MKFRIIIAFQHILILEKFQFIIGNLLYICKNNIRIWNSCYHLFTFRA